MAHILRVFNRAYATLWIIVAALLAGAGSIMMALDPGLHHPLPEPVYARVTPASIEVRDLRVSMSRTHAGQYDVIVTADINYSGLTGPVYETVVTNVVDVGKFAVVGNRRSANQSDVRMTFNASDVWVPTADQPFRFAISEALDFGLQAGIRNRTLVLYFYADPPYGTGLVLPGDGKPDRSYVRSIPMSRYPFNEPRIRVARTRARLADEELR